MSDCLHHHHHDIPPIIILLQPQTRMHMQENNSFASLQKCGLGDEGMNWELQILKDTVLKFPETI